MGLWDFICEDILCPIGSAIDSGVCAVGRGVDSVVTNVVIDGACGAIDSAVDFVKENPGEAALTSSPS